MTQQMIPGQPIVVQFPNLSELQRQANAAPRILALAGDIPVTNTEQAVIANGVLQDLLRARDALEKDRTDVTGPLHKTKAWIDSQYRPVRDTLDMAVKIVKDKVSGFLLLQKQEQDRQFRLAQDANARGDHQAMALALNESSAIETAAPEGTSVREIWDAEVFNPAIVQYEFLCPDMNKIQAHARSFSAEQEPTPISGVRFTKRAITTVRR